MGHGAHIFNEQIQVTRILGTVKLPVEVLLARLEVCVHVNPAVGNIDCYDIPVLDQSKRSHQGSLRGDVADGKTGCTAGETSVGYDGAGIEEFLAAFQVFLEGECRGTKAALQSKEAQHAGISGLDLAGLEGL